MKNDSGWGCVLLPILLMLVIGIFNFILDNLEEHNLCYSFIPFCDSEQEKAEKRLDEIQSIIYRKVETLSRDSGVRKWQTITEYKSKNGGYIYYLGTNTLNGIYLYWDGDVNNYYLKALDYQAQDKLSVRLYEGKDRLDLMDEFTESEEANILNEKFVEIFN